MSQHNQQQQQQQPKAEPWKPTTRTYFLLQSDAEFEPRARAYVANKYGPGALDQESGERTAWRVRTSLNVNALNDSSVIVVLYMNPSAPIKAADGYRERDRGSRVGGRVERKPEKPAVLETKPIACKDFRKRNAEGDDITDGPGICRAITALIHPARAQYTDRDKETTISVRAT